MTTTDTTTLTQVMQELTRPEARPLDENTPRRHGLVLIPETPGPVIEIDEETYWHYLEILPPYYFDGNRFCFAEGIVPFHLFFKRGKRYFVRLLTWEETCRLCQLADVPSPGR
jgi:hypothetical protein